MCALFTRFEFHPPYKGSNVTALIVQRLHPAGVRATVPTSEVAPPASEQERLFRQGYDVVYTYAMNNAIKARTTIDEERHISPP